MKGRFIVLDGPDGVGKSVFLNTLIEESKKKSLKIFDVNLFWKENDRLPTMEEISEYNVLITSEPTFFGAGKLIRNILISNSSPVKYSTLTIAQGYALDRHVLHEGLIIPALEKGIHVFQSRSVSTSIVYQKLTGEKDNVSLSEVINIPGNSFALKHAADILIILTIDDPKEIINRLEKRDKDDDAIFENLEFQMKVKKEFESDWFRELFENRGTRVVYMDAGKTIEYSKEQMREFFMREF
jgi:dTMP kinase